MIHYLNLVGSEFWAAAVCWIANELSTYSHVKNTALAQFIKFTMFTYYFIKENKLMNESDCII